MEPSNIGNTSKKQKTIHHSQWSAKEDEKLVECLVELKDNISWRGDGINFRSGYLKELEKMLEEKLPGCGLKSTPHIESRVKTLLRQYFAIAEMLGPNCSGFGWNDKDKCIIADKDVFDEWVKGHRDATGMRNKPFIHYDNLTIVYGKDRANGEGAVGPEEMVQEIDKDEQEINDDKDVDEVMEVELSSNNDIPPGFQPPKLTQASKKGDKKRSRSNDNLLESVLEEFGNFSNAYRESRNDIREIATFFKKETESNERKGTLFQEIMKIDGLSEKEMMDAGELIMKDSHKLDFFFALPEKFRKGYVVKQLKELHGGYRPTFDFDPQDD